MGCDIFLLRQVFVLTAACLWSFSSGVMLAFPAVLNPSILSPNSTIHVTSDQASWIAASNGFSGLLGFCIVSPLFQIVGRKYVNFGVAIALMIGWVIFFFARTIYDLLIARIVQGIDIGSYYICAITISEYCDPKRRGYFLTMKKISQALGSLACHSLAFFIDWRLISVFAAAPVVLATIMILFWPESPAFLAMKGKFDESGNSFTWLNGTSPEKLEELKDLINAQTERIDKKKKSPIKSTFMKLLNKLRRKDFVKPFIILSLLTLAIDASGRYFLLAYLTQILVEITENKSVAMYCAIASDFLLMCALLISCFLIRSFNRRTLLFALGIFATILMFIVSLAQTLKFHFGIAENIRWFIPSVILMHSFVSHVGLIPTAFAISGEILPLEHKGFGCFTSGIVYTTFYALSLKLTPRMIESTGVAGTYAIYGTCTVLCLALLYSILPETKDKTLQQIEDELKGVKRTSESDVLIHNDTTKNT